MTMTVSEKLAVLCAHYKIDDKSMSTKDRMRAVRKAANESSIDAAYSKLPADVRAAAEKPPTPKKDEPAKDGEVLPPVATPVAAAAPVKVDGAQQRVDVAAPAMSFHLAPATINVERESAPWSVLAQRAFMYGFVFASGAMFGILVTIARIKGV